MTDGTPTTCSQCGATATGHFCAACGAPLGQPTCPSCGTELTAGAKFCHKCGAVATRATASGGPANAHMTPARQNGDRTPWIVAAILVVAIIFAVGYSAKKRADPNVPLMANAGNGSGAAGGDLNGAGTIPAPNIDSLSPKERFIRLQTRIDQQLERRDTTRLMFFMQMALQAYALLPESDRDVDVRFHAAMLQVEAGVLPGALALADTIMKMSPDNLLGYYVRASAAESAGDAAKAKAARAAFRDHYDAELKKNRPEYAEHRPFLEQYRKGAGAR